MSSKLFVVLFAVLFAVLSVMAAVQPTYADKGGVKPTKTEQAANGSQTTTDDDQPGHSKPDSNGKGPERSDETDPDARETNEHWNNGCGWGNEPDRTDDNEGWCGQKPKASPTPKPSVTPTTTPCVGVGMRVTAAAKPSLPWSRLREVAARLLASVPLAALALIVVIVVLFLRAKGPVNPDAAVLSDEFWGLNDFRYTIYYPSVALLDGVNPYDPDVYRATYPVKTFPLYSPITLVLYAPLALLPVQAALWVYFALTIGLYGLLAALLLRFAGREWNLAWLLWLWTFILVCRPGHQNLLNGQSTAQAVLGLLLAVQYASTRPVLAGIGILLAAPRTYADAGAPLVITSYCTTTYENLRNLP